MNKNELSLVVPCHNEAETLPILLDAIQDELPAFQQRGVSLAVLLIDDGSTDNTVEVMRSFAGMQPGIRIDYISFSRNFGKEAAMYAGLSAAKGEYVALLDADMQDPPSLLPQMYDMVASGKCDTAATRRVTREGEPPIRSFFARMFYKLINKISDVEIVDGARDFRLMNRKVVDAVLSLSEKNRFSKGIFGWVGFKTEWIAYTNVERAAGNTNWNFWSLMVYALEGIISFSTVPLAMVSGAGLIFCLIAIVSLIFVIVRAALFGDPVSGWPSLICTLLIVSGVQLLCLGVVGQYLSKAYVEIKQRPIFVVGESSFTE